jgi:hypothetical protein
MWATVKEIQQRQIREFFSDRRAEHLPVAFRCRRSWNMRVGNRWQRNHTQFS